jgi:hypothetical protein
MRKNGGFNLCPFAIQMDRGEDKPRQLLRILNNAGRKRAGPIFLANTVWTSLAEYRDTLFFFEG